jgi:Co/Zn/Cd efflux system component
MGHISRAHRESEALMHHIDKTQSTLNARVWLVMFLNIGMACTELIAGVVGGSVVLIADSVHNFGDIGTLVLAG